MCSCNTGIETANHFLHCKLHTNLGRKFLSTINHILPKTYKFVDDDLVIQMFSLPDNPDHSIKTILEATVRYINENNGFKNLILWPWEWN